MCVSVCLFGFIERSHSLANIVGVTPPSQSQTTLPCEHVSNGPRNTGVSLGPWGPPINGLWFYLPLSLPLSLWAWTIVVAACHEKLHCDWLFYLSPVKPRLLLLLLLLDIYFQVTATCVAFIAALIVYFFLISFCLIIYCLFIFVL